MLKDEKKPEVVAVEEVKPVEAEAQEEEEVQPVEDVKEEEVKVEEETTAESEGVWSYISNTFWWLLGYKN